MSNLMPNGREKTDMLCLEPKLMIQKKKKVEALERIANALGKLTHTSSGATNSLFDKFLGK